MFGWIAALRRGKENKDVVTHIMPVNVFTKAGVYVDPDRALLNATTWACVRFLSQTTAQLPWGVYEPTGDESSRMLPKHQAHRLISKRPNREWSSFQFRETLTSWALRHGNGYAEIERDVVGRAIALWPIHPDRVEPKRDAATGELYYEVDNGTGGKTIIPMMDMFHLRGFGDGPVGYGIVEFAAQSIGWARAAQIFGAAFFGEGMNPAGVVEVNGSLSATGLKRLRAEFDKLYKGPSKSNRTAFLDAGMKWNKMSATPDEAQFIETMKFQVEEVCRWFGVPPHKVMHLDRSTFNNIEHQSIEVVTDSIVPWTLRFEEEADFKLFGANRQGLFTKMDLTSLLKADAAARGEFYRKLFDMGVLTPNEIRAKEGLNPISDAEGGNKRLVQVNLTTLENAGNAVLTATQPEQPIAPDEDEDDAEDEPQPDSAEAEAEALLKTRLNALKELLNEQH